MSPEEKAIEDRRIETTVKLTWSTVASLMAGLITSIAAAASLTSVKGFIDFVKKVDSTEWPVFGVSIIAALLTVVVSIISLFISRRDKKK